MSRRDHETGDSEPRPVPESDEQPVDVSAEQDDPDRTPTSPGVRSDPAADTAPALGPAVRGAGPGKTGSIPSFADLPHAEDTPPVAAVQTPPTDHAGPSTRVPPDAARGGTATASVVRPRATLAERLRRTLRDRFGREALARAVLGVLAIVCAALIVAVIIKTQDDAARAAREAASYTPPAVTTTDPTTDPTTPARPPAPAAGTVVVIGDETAASTAGPQRWTALIAKALDAKVDTIAAPGAGFVAEGDSGTFADAALQVAESATVVVVFGGANDAEESPFELMSAVERTVARVERAAPEARVVLVGPAVDGPGVRDVGDTIASAARATGVRFGDPIADGWIASSGSAALSAADQKALARRFRNLLGPLLT